MPSSKDHSKIIAQAAKETLAPLGIFQKGRSRTWIDDRGWWIVVIEFQPSGFSKGSSLNVGAMWLWHEKDYFSFDAGNDGGCRISKFAEYVDEKQFEPEAFKLANAAKTEALRLRKKFASIDYAAYHLSGQAKRTENSWTSLAAAIALGYIGKASMARKLFKEIERKKPTQEWEHRVREMARGFAETLDRPGDDFQRSVIETIVRTRKLLKLPERIDLGIGGKENDARPLQKFRLPFI